MGSVGLQRLAIFLIHLPFSTQPPLPSLLLFTSSLTSSVCYGLYLAVTSELFLRSEKGSAAKPVFWHQTSVPVAGTQPTPAQFHGSERD